MNDRRSNQRLASLFLAMAIALPGAACAGEEQGTAETGTIAPATPEPNVDVENDPALTRTIDPGEDRSPYEGGPLADDEVIGGTTTSDTAGTTREENPPDTDDSTP